MNHLERLDLSTIRREWRATSPYLTLRFICGNPDASLSRIASLLVRLGIDASPDSTLASTILRELLIAGHIFEAAENRFRALPPYAVQRADDEWLLLGDVSPDGRIAEKCLFEVRTSVKPAVSLERLAVVPGANAEAILACEGIRLFGRADLLNLVPDIREMYSPLVWEGFEPSAFGRWEVLDPAGSWRGVPGRPDQAGLCRGVVVDNQGNTLATRYFWRHDDGWSPLSSDDAIMWVLKLTDQVRINGPATFRDSTLEVPVRLPYRAFTALRYLAKAVITHDGRIRAEGIDEKVASQIVDRLGLSLRSV